MCNGSVFQPPTEQNYIHWQMANDYNHRTDQGHQHCWHNVELADDYTQVICCHCGYEKKVDPREAGAHGKYAPLYPPVIRITLNE